MKTLTISRAILFFCIMWALFLLLSGCSTPFAAHKEKGWVCKDVVRHLECVKASDRYDNVDLHDHDPRELRDIDVPNF